MSQFLSNGYHFTINNLMDKSAYLLKLKWQIIILLAIIIFTFILIVAFMTTFKGHKYAKIYATITTICVLTMLVSGMSMVYLFYRNGFSQNPISTPISYLNKKFKFADKSNLYITIDQAQPKTRLDNTSYPYKIYISDDFDVSHDKSNQNDSYEEIKSRHYIGSMNHGKFKPNDTQFATAFYKYAQYIKQHNLDDKFKKCAYLEYDAKYMNNDHKPQVVLTNHKDTVLYLNNNSLVKQSNVVKN